ncbi:hypothetical protein CUJ83_06400 [Methanocella sp. CWC-04]|uniref:Uncharacterized protein n=1 Tax=Methanooceanicella nereidis TaxID=2052831 RepID=A0AAP2W6U9_9EURY|nr:hypothetical protein [Methanocella sp. CWC-04]MCD1294629.1 hypothetical protein [Methanocella sp. CWC-04]
MKITREAYEMAKVSAKESEVPLILTGERGVIMDIMISPSEEEFDTSAGMLPSMLPAGIRRYGKVLTKNDQDLEPGYNLIEKDGEWKFVDENGDDMEIEIVEDVPKSPMDMDFMSIE